MALIWLVEVQSRVFTAKCPYDNAAAEAAFKIIKTEFVRNQRFYKVCLLNLKIIFSGEMSYSSHRWCAKLIKRAKIEFPSLPAKGTRLCSPGKIEVDVNERAVSIRHKAAFVFTPTPIVSLTSDRVDLSMPYWYNVYFPLLGLQKPI